VELLVEDPCATVDDLLDALPLERGDAAGVLVEGRWVDGGCELTALDLHDGAVLHLAAGPGVGAGPGAGAGPGGADVWPSSPSGGPDLVVVAGPDAGRQLALDGRAATVGRDPGCALRLDDPTVSRWHLDVAPSPDGSWRVRDLGSANGAWVDGDPVHRSATIGPDATIRLGATHLRLRHDRVEDRPLGAVHLRATGGRVPFNRPPRPATPPALDLLDLPDEPGPSAARRALSLVSIAAPVLLAGVLVWGTGNPRFALFLLLSPVMAVGNWVAGRRQAAAEDRANDRAYRRALGQLDRDLRAASAAERARREVLLPDLAEVVRRVHAPSSQLWQRRPHHDDFLALCAGIGDVPWEPPVQRPRERPPAPVQEVLGRHMRLRGAPVEVDLADGGVVGLVGDRGAALALARALVCQAAVHHGPADLAVTVVAGRDRVCDWDWAKWLPHVSAAHVSAARVASAHVRDTTASVRLDEADAQGRHELVVLDDVALLHDRRAPARHLLRGGHHPVAGIVLADSADQLPAVTTTVIELPSGCGDARLRRPQEAWEVAELVIGGCTERTARALARTLARYEDPELEAASAGLPRRVRLLSLLGMEDLDVAVIEGAWAAGPADPPLAVPIGVGDEGVVELDLVADGPHGLIAGTTGSGKSELLRSLVAGLAARVDPDHLVFVLVDFKGGSAFDRCADLPHTVGAVTDLDGHLGERALRSLEAELRHRERVLRAAGAQDLSSYLRAGAPAGPLPRLLVVIDEFATLATELPDLLGALVGIAQRGRSLGVHLLLATQRPSGSVTADIKANTDLRVALRVQDANDSTDIIGRGDAAGLARAIPGRAYIRWGSGAVTLVQTPLATASAPPARRDALGVRPFRFAPSSDPAADAAATVPDAAATVPDAGLEADARLEVDAGLEAGAGPSDLDRLVATIGAAFARSGRRAPRRPWLEMLPDHLTLPDLIALDGVGDDTTLDGGAATVGAVVGLADDPDRQRQVPMSWDAAEGHLGVFGKLGSGTTTTLTTVALSLADRHAPDRLHLHALDLGAGGLAHLAGLPHIGTVVPAADTELRAKLLRSLCRELDRRRELPVEALAVEPRVVVLVDGVGSLLAELEGPDGFEEVERFRRLVADGPAVGIALALAGHRVGALPARYAASVPRKLLLEHTDPHELAGVGLRASALPTFVPGRGIDARSQLVVQVADPGPLAEQVATIRDRWAGRSGPRPVRTLPVCVDAGQLPPGRVDGQVLDLPIGLAEEDVVPVALRLLPTGHALVAGAPRSGVTSTLALLAHQVRAADPDAVIVGLCDERSPLYGAGPLDAAGALADLVRVVGAAAVDERRWVVLVDDAPALADVDGALAALLSCGRPGLHVIAAGRTDELRGGFAHWTRPLRRARAGVLLQPNLAADGELLGVRLPRRTPVGLGHPGRGFVVSDATARLAQIAAAPPRVELGDTAVEPVLVGAVADPVGDDRSRRDHP
jgi:DNA segregation ATPase FtsK/SpoIIIE, S-DNA-T family